MVISQERLDEVQTIKNEIGWSWDTVANRLGWTPHQMRQVRALRIPVADEHIAWLLTVKAAIDAIPVPGPEVFMPQPEQTPTVQDVKVMLLEDIAAKLVEEYFAIGEEASADELAGARYMVGRLAERCGVADEVREAIRERQAKPMFEQFPPQVIARDPVVTGLTGIAQPAPAIRNPFAQRERVPMED